MSTIAKLQAQKELLLEKLKSEPGPNEREEIQTLLTKIETALSLLGREAGPPTEDFGSGS